MNLKEVTFGYQSFSRGVDRNILKINETLILPLICYEVIDTGTININKKNFDIIFNISEDGWFDDQLGLINILFIQFLDLLKKVSIF